MEKEGLIVELFKSVKSDFDRHIKHPNNNRLIFSGKYGVGKTTFLTHYFDERKDKYNIIKLNPIDYSIASNEDILMYVKYDIMYHLLENEQIDFETFDFSKLETASYFLHDNILDVFSVFLPLIPKFGGTIQKVYKGLKELNTSYKEFHEASNKNTEKIEVDSFMTDILKKEGSIYENNIITQIVKNSLKNLKEEDCENVLIIDDLDRIDPHHIFRLFNVFAAHLNNKQDLQDKFGFDRVIFVCDIENVRNIFKNRYGADVDFNGYIDKFYSRKIFYYNSNDEVEAYSRNLIRSIDFRFEDEAIQNYWGTSGVGREDFYDELNVIVSKLILSNQLNLRRLLKDKKEFIFENKTIKFPFDNRPHEVQNWQLNSTLIIEFLLSLLGEKNDLIDAMEFAIDERDTSAYLKSGNLCHILALTEFRTHKFKREAKIDFSFDKHQITCELVTGHRADFIRLDYQVDKDIGIGGTLRAISHPNSNDEKKYNLFNLYLKGIKILDEIGYLK